MENGEQKPNSALEEYVSIADISNAANARYGSVNNTLNTLQVPHRIVARGKKEYKIIDLISTLFQFGKKEPSSSSGNVTDSEARLKKAKADLAEIDLKKQIGDLVSIEDVVRQVASEYHTIRSQFVTLGNSVALQLVNKDPEEVANIINGRVAEILAALVADQKYSSQGNLEVSENHEPDATAETHSS